MKNLLLLVIIILICISANADDVNLSTARTVAETHLQTHSDFAETISSFKGGFGISEIHTLRDDEGAPLAYIFDLEPIGYIAVTPNTNIVPVLAYSFLSNFVMKDTPLNTLLHMIIGDMKLRREALPITSRGIIHENNCLWDSYLTDREELIRSSSSMVVYGPWIDTRWSQGYPYNMYCPIDPGTGSRCVSGCVGIAMAQILNYWEYPAFVAFNDDESYWSGYTSPAIFIDAPTASDDTIEYNYAGTDNPSNSEIGSLVWAAGVSVYSWYSSGGTGASVHSDYYIDKWGYDPEAFDMSGDHYFFYDYLMEDMIDGCPVQLSIYQDDWTGGHSIVCDGYNSTTDYYHLNMGWGGSTDGWYSLPAGMPLGYSIITRAVMNIEPAPRVDAPSTCAEAMTLCPSEASQEHKDAIYRPGDEDWFAFDASTDSSYIFYSKGSTNMWGEIYSACGTAPILSNGSGISRDNFFLQFTPTVPGTYYLKVRGVDAWEFGLYELYYRTGRGPSINVRCPHGGEVVNEGDNQIIQWTSNGVPDFTAVRLEYSIHGPDGPWVIIADTSDLTFHIWTLPDVHYDKDSVYVKITSVEYNMVAGVSVGAITIRDIYNIAEQGLPEILELTAYPNPFNSAVRISVGEGPRPSRVEIFDINGKRVRGFEGSRVQGGTPNADNRASINEFVWTPEESVGSGIYLVHVTIDYGQTATRRVVYLK